jgi:hypothetical protein
MTETKISHRECERERRKAFFPKKMLPFWIITGLIFAAAIFCLLPMSAGTADFIHKYFFIPYRRVTLPFFEIFRLTAWETVLTEIFTILALIIFGLVTLVRFFARKQSSKVEIVIFYILVGVFVLFLFLICHGFFGEKTTTIAEKMGFEDRVYTEEKTAAFRKIVIIKLNELSVEVPRDENGNVIIDKYDMEIYKKAAQNIADEVPFLDGYYAVPQLSDDPLEMYAFDRLEGVTNAANHIVEYSDRTPALRFGTMIPHEMAHSFGYNREDEASFIGALACLKSGDPALEYSAWFCLALSLGAKDIDDLVKAGGTFTDEFTADWNYYWADSEASDVEYMEREGITEEEFQQRLDGATSEDIEKMKEEEQKIYARDVILVMGYIEAYPDEIELDAA